MPLKARQFWDLVPQRKSKGRNQQSNEGKKDRQTDELNTPRLNSKTLVFILSNKLPLSYHVAKCAVELGIAFVYP